MAAPPEHTENHAWDLLLKLTDERLAVNIAALDERVRLRWKHDEERVQQQLRERDLLISAHREHSILTTDLLKGLINEQQEKLKAAMDAASQAVGKSEASQEKRLDSMNEFRNAMSDQQRTLLPRSEMLVISDSITERHNTLASSVNEMDIRLRTISDQVSAHRTLETQERNSFAGGWGMAFGVIGSVIAIIAVAIAFLKH